jgi:amino acid efflux transporter
VAAVAALVLTMGATNAYLSGATEMILQLTARRQTRRPETRLFLLLIGAVGLLLIGLYALHLVSTTALVMLPTTMFLVVYLTCTVSAARVLCGPGRMAAVPAALAVAGILAFCGWALAAAGAVAAIAALATRRTAAAVC